MNLFTSVTQTAQNQNTGITATDRRGARAEQSWNAGDIITAMLMEKNNDTATLRAKDDTVFQTSSQTIRGNVGDTLTFQVVKNDKKGFSLKQLYDRNETQRRPRGHADITAEVKEVNKNLDKISSEDKKRYETQQEAQIKMARAVARIQRAQSYMANSASKSAMAALVESGLSLSKISFNLLNRVMHEVDKRPSEEEAAEDIKIDFSFAHPTDKKLITQSLHRHGLAVTDKNAATLERAWEKVPPRVDDRTIEKLVADESELTLEKLYVGRYSARERTEDATNTHADTWASLAGETRKLFAREGIAETDENRDAARFLVTRDLPLDKENVEKVVFLRHLSERLPKDVFFDKAAERIASDQNLSELPLADIAAKETRRDGSKMTERANRMMEAVKPLLSAGSSAPADPPASAETLRRALMAEPGMRWDEQISARRTLSEIQLKFTAEAAARLREVTPVDTAPLREALQFLTQRENEVHARFLRMAGTDDGPEPVGRMASLFDKLAEIRPLTVNVHADILLNHAEFTITGVHESVKAARARTGYETFATVPSVKYGDSFTKVRAQFTPFLEDKGITPTTENLKAAFILSRNGMEVNEDNLLSVKEIDAKVNAIANNLHPMIAAQMIRDGLAPADMQADEVLAYIRQFKQTLGEDGSDKIARYIMEMDKDASLDADTRKRMIAMYRMLHVIQKDGAAALGLASHLRDTAESSGNTTAPGNTLTLGRMMELSQYYEKHKRTDTVFDRSVNDAFGALERLTRPEESIRGLLTPTGQAPLSYHDLLVDSFTDRAAPGQLRTLLTEVPQVEDKPLEDILNEDMLTNSDEIPPETAVNRSLPETMLQMQTFLSATPGLIHLLHNRGIQATAGVLKAADKLTRSPRALADALEEVIETQEDEESDELSVTEMTMEAITDTDLQPLKEGQNPGQLFERLSAALEDARVKAVSAGQIERITAARQLAGLRCVLNGDNGFEIPIRMNGHISGLSLYVLNEQAMLSDGARVLLSLDTRTMGTVQGYFTLNGGAVDLQVTADTPEAVAGLESAGNTLRAMLEEAGLTINQLQFAVSERRRADAHHLPLGTGTPVSTPAIDKPRSDYEFTV